MVEQISSDSDARAVVVEREAILAGKRGADAEEVGVPRDVIENVEVALRAVTPRKSSHQLRGRNLVPSAAEF